MKTIHFQKRSVAAFAAALAIPAAFSIAQDDPAPGDAPDDAPPAAEADSIDVQGRFEIEGDSAAATHTRSIAAIAGNDVSLTMLSEAIKAAGLEEALSGEGSFTLFAPTNQAFTALPEGTLDSLMEPENNERLAAILNYHLLPNAVKSDAMGEEMAVETVGGQSVTVTPGSDERPITVNNARVLKADIMASNGVIHAVNRVLMPPEGTTAPAE
ncbi:hypothetical protein BH23VER1_BH23VER1_11750 [soil metagenome]